MSETLHPVARRAPWPVWMHVTIAACLLATVAVLDVTKPFERSLSIFYLLPILYVAWKVRGAAEWVMYGAVLLAVYCLPLIREPDISQVWRGGFNRTQGVILGGILIFFIWERRRAFDALSRSEQRFRALVEQAYEGITCYDSAGRLTYASPSNVNLDGRPPEDTLGTDGFGYVHPDDLPAARAAWAELLANPGRPLALVLRVSHKDGSWIWVEVTARNCLDNPAVAAVVVNWRDVSARIRAEEELVRQHATLEQQVAERTTALAESREWLQRANDALRDADRRKDEFLATLAHELRNPLAPIRNAVTVMRQYGMADPRSEQARDWIDEQVTQMTRLLDDLLDVARVTRGKLDLRLAPTELAAVVRLAERTNRPLIEQCGHELTVRLPAEPVYLHADRTRLAQVFDNLLNNAAKYTPPGGRIRLTAERDGGAVVVTVQDEGIGIPADVLPRVFDLFEQGDAPPDMARGGLGIGLSLVRRLVELHGGRVTAHSDGPGRGSTFVVRLPTVVAPAPPPAPPPPAPPDRPGALRILVADDHPAAAESLRLVLEAAGHECHVAYDGADAFDQAAAWRPDAVVLDLGMPKQSGYDVARRLRGEPWGQALALIAVSGWGAETDRQRTRAAGFDQHLVKPVSSDELLQALARRGPAAPPGKYHILIAEDNALQALSLQVALEALGHEVRTAADGVTAFEVAQAWRPHVVVSDLNLPRLSGYELAHRLRAQPWGRHLILLAVSGHSQPEDLRRATAAGFDRHLTKPVPPEDIGTVLADLAAVAVGR